MRKLTEKELDQVKKAIAAKELTSAEILVEIYDHYISHLEGFEKEGFESELIELEQKFSHGYCHALQAKLNKEVRKEIGKLQWIVIKRNFCLPRIIYIIGFMSVAFYLSATIDNIKEAAFMMVLPLLIMTGFHIFFLVNSSNRIKAIKRSLNYNHQLHSSLYYPLSERMYLPVMMSYLIVWGSEKIFDSQIISNPALQIAITFSIILFIYLISLLEVWKIKSRTALI